jgi:hypothetical protein
MNFIVKTVRRHVGGLMCGGSTTIEADKHKVQMQLLPVGVLVKEQSGKSWVIPYPNVIDVLVEEKAEKPEKALKA